MGAASDFQKNHGKPGWVYVTRNDLMREDIYKVGCTAQQHPEKRTSQLNSGAAQTEHRASGFSTSFLQLLCSSSHEAALLRRVEVLKESRGKEFVNAPLDLILGELLHIQKKDLQTVSSVAHRPSCDKPTALRLTHMLGSNAAIAMRHSYQSRPVDCVMPRTNEEEVFRSVSALPPKRTIRRKC